jgi:hypothetical protein
VAVDDDVMKASEHDPMLPPCSWKLGQENFCTGLVGEHMFE